MFWIAWLFTVLVLAKVTLLPILVISPLEPEGREVPTTTTTTTENSTFNEASPAGFALTPIEVQWRRTGTPSSTGAPSVTEAPLSSAGPSASEGSNVKKVAKLSWNSSGLSDGGLIEEKLSGCQSEEYPWMGLFTISDGSSCGSSLLNGRFLLTAAHCCESRFDSSSGRINPG